MLSPKLRPKGVKTLVASPLRWAKDPRGEDAAKAAVSCVLVLGGSAPKRRKKIRKKKKRKGKKYIFKKKKFAGSSTDLEWSLRGKGEEGWMERGVAGEGSAGEGGRERASPGGSGGGEPRAGCVSCCLSQLSPLTERLLSLLLFFSSCSVAPNLTSLPQPSV